MSTEVYVKYLRAVGGWQVAMLLIAIQVHCSALQHAATHCNTLQHTAVGGWQVAMLLIAIQIHHSALQHTATHCNTLVTCVYDAYHHSGTL